MQWSKKYGVKYGVNVLKFHIFALCKHKLSVR